MMLISFNWNVYIHESYSIDITSFHFDYSLSNGIGHHISDFRWDSN